MSVGLQSKAKLCLGFDLNLLAGAQVTQQPNIPAANLLDRINWALAGFGNLVPGTFSEPARISTRVTNTAEATILARKTTTITYSIRGG